MNKKCVICDTSLNGKQKKYCSNACKQKHHWVRIKEQSNTYHSQTIRAYKRKMILIEMSGGCCNKCSYKKNISALQFHHRNPSEKEFQLELRQLSNRNWDTILKEHAKCDLLCGNCHSEHHNPEMDYENIKLIINN
jgi:hypothetical protein